MRVILQARQIPPGLRNWERFGVRYAGMTCFLSHCEAPSAYLAVLTVRPIYADCSNATFCFQIKEGGLTRSRIPESLLPHSH